MTLALAQPTMLDLLRLCHDARPDEREQYEELSGIEWIPDEVAADLYGRSGVKFVLLNHDSLPIVAGGYMPIMDGVYDSWMVGTMSNWNSHWRSITKYTRKVMNLMFTEVNARRLQTSVLASRTAACEWYVRGLLMQREGLLRGFGATGADMAMYARINEDGRIIK
jgi:hypothetical protein